jgi:thiol-disulfide isomerase/thioredoxin
MSTLSELVQRFISPYYYYIVAIIVAVIFGFIAKYAYDNYYNEKMTDKKKFSDVANANTSDNEVIVLFFHADWCPHCKTAKPEWVKFKGEYDGKGVNGYTVVCKDINCTEETSDVTNAINEYQIDSYPTVKMLKDGQKIEFDSKITQYTLEQFVTTMTTN